MKMMLLAKNPNSPHRSRTLASATNDDSPPTEALILCFIMWLDAKKEGKREVEIVKICTLKSF